jgi:PHD/YefM family antitoxin component YafN of YafNO toxin-antitoxin module
MSTVAEIEEAVSALPADDFERLMGDLRDLQLARERLAEIEAGAETVSLDDLEKRLAL